MDTAALHLPHLVFGGGRKVI